MLFILDLNLHTFLFLHISLLFQMFLVIGFQILLYSLINIIRIIINILGIIIIIIY
jgi:hypothetical protein